MDWSSKGVVRSKRSFMESKLGHANWRSDRSFYVLILDTQDVASSGSQCQTHTRHCVLVMPKHGMFVVVADMGSLIVRPCIGGSGVLHTVASPSGKELLHNSWRRNCFLVVIAATGS